MVGTGQVQGMGVTTNWKEATGATALPSQRTIIKDNWSASIVRVFAQSWSALGGAPNTQTGSGSWKTVSLGVMRRNVSGLLILELEVCWC